MAMDGKFTDSPAIHWKERMRMPHIMHIMSLCYQGFIQDFSLGGGGKFHIHFLIRGECGRLRLENLRLDNVMFANLCVYFNYGKQILHG